MNECQTQGGAAFTVEAEVIHHAVHPDLISPIEEEGETHVLKQDGSSSDMERFLYDNKEFCSQAPLTFEREYLLDGNLMQNHCLDQSKGNGSYIQNTNQFHISTEKGSLNLTDLHNTASTPEIEQNFTPAGRNGIGETVNGARATPHSHGQATERMEGCVSLSTESSVSGRCQSTESSVSGRCQRGNVTTYSEQRDTAPYTHCVPAGPQPTVEELGRLFAHGCHTAEQNPLHGPSAQETSLGNRDRAPAGEKEPDLVIEVGGQKISAHKSVLAEQSDYFKARLSRDVLKVKGLNFQTLTVLIDYVYTSRMSVHKDNVVDVITGAKVLQIPCAVQAAMDSMSEQITTGNCYEILTIAKKQRLSELKATAYRFMSDNFLQILRDPAVYGRLTGSERDLILKKRTEGKKSLMIAEINDVFDRVGSRPASRCNSRPQSPLSVSSLEENHMIYYFNDTENDWRPLTVMPEDINTKGCGICTMYNYLFVAGGIKGYGDKGKVSDKVFCYNPVTNSWSEVRPLIQARSQLKLVSMDGNLYAIGGECLFTVEKYDPRMDRWTTVAPLPKGAFAVAHEAISCNGELYVSGGSLFYRLLKYDPKRDEWQESPYNNSRKRSTDMMAFKSFLYRFDVNRDQGINVFKYNTIVKMWHDCASQRLGSSFPFRCAVIGNCIYCVNKTQTLQFIVEEENCYFVEEPLRAPLEAKGILFPFILSLPEKPEKIA